MQVVQKNKGSLHSLRVNLTETIAIVRFGYSLYQLQISVGY